MEIIWFRKVAVVGSLLWLITSPITGTWLGLKYQVWIFYYLMDLQYNLIPVGYPQDNCILGYILQNRGNLLETVIFVADFQVSSHSLLPNPYPDMLGIFSSKIFFFFFYKIF